MTATLAGQPGRCCVPGCGKPHRACLCADCYRQYAPDGHKPPWLRSLQREAMRQTMRRRRQRVTIQRLAADW